MSGTVEQWSNGDGRLVRRARDRKDTAPIRRAPSGSTLNSGGKSGEVRHCELWGYGRL